MIWLVAVKYVGSLVVGLYNPYSLNELQILVSCQFGLEVLMDNMGIPEIIMGMGDGQLMYCLEWVKKTFGCDSM